ncbi:MAG: hypothetical protein JXQ81_00400 [Desulfuromonadales bacterium]|nr:hypothetical protein [Desulfuromonadales bacterium]MBN2790943.1 hypothetical protein [Desulfuromonadales bacterium]
MAIKHNKQQHHRETRGNEEWSFLWIVMILIVTLTGFWFMWQNQATTLLH